MRNQFIVYCPNNLKYETEEGKVEQYTSQDESNDEDPFMGNETSSEESFLEYTASLCTHVTNLDGEDKRQIK